MRYAVDLGNSAAKAALRSGGALRTYRVAAPPAGSDVAAWSTRIDTLLDLIGGEVQLMFSPAAAVAPYRQSGRLRALAVTSLKESPLAPGLPTIAAAVPGYEAVTMYGLYAPAKTPKAIINTLRDAVVGVIREPHNSEQLENWGLTPVGGTPDEFGAFLKKEIGKYQRIVREAKIARS